MPVLIIPLIFMQGAIFTLIPKKIIITDKFIKEESSSPKKVKWKNVNSWHLEEKNNKLVAVFMVKFGSKKEFSFNQELGRTNLIELLKRYGKI